MKERCQAAATRQQAHDTIVAALLNTFQGVVPNEDEDPQRQRGNIRTKVPITWPSPLLKPQWLLVPSPRWYT